jgi:hypothetical protein
LAEVIVFYSVRKLVTGLAIAAFIAWKLIVIIVITMAVTPAITNTTGLIVIP